MSQSPSPSLTHRRLPAHRRGFAVCHPAAPEEGQASQDVELLVSKVDASYALLILNTYLWTSHLSSSHEVEFTQKFNRGMLKKNKLTKLRVEKKGLADPTEHAADTCQGKHGHTHTHSNASLRWTVHRRAHDNGNEPFSLRAGPMKRQWVTAHLHST